MEHFSGQDDFLENNLLSPEDLRFGAVCVYEHAQSKLLNIIQA